MSVKNKILSLTASLLLLTMLTLNVARYQNGSVENLLELFHQLGRDGS